MGHASNASGAGSGAAFILNGQDGAERSADRSIPFPHLFESPIEAAGSGLGAAAAAGVLTAVDEDGEGDEEASCPEDFEYFADGDAST